MKEKRIKVLLIEDDLIDQMAFKRMVANFDLPYDYQVADCVHKALELLEENDFDIILADFNLGDGNAFDVFKEVNDTPFVLVTGSGDEATAVDAMKMGVKEYLVKDNERTYLQLLPVTVKQTLKHWELEKTQAKSQNKINMLFRAVEQSSASVVITDPDGSIEYVNPKFEEVSGYSSNEVIGQNPRILKTDYHDVDFYKELWDTIKSGKTWTGEFLNQKKNGLTFWEMATISPVFNEETVLTNLIAVKEDVTEQKRIKQALEFRVQFEELINAISTNFINLTANKINEEVSNSLGKIGRFIHIDRSYVYQYDLKKEKLMMTHHWLVPDIKESNPLPDEILPDRIPWMISRFADEEMLFLPSLFSLPKTAAADRAFLEEADVKSILVLPMVYEQKLMGMLWLDNVTSEKFWDIDTIKLLRILVEIIVNALQRRMSAEKIENLYNSLKQEVELASSVQTYLIPQWLRYEDGILFSSIYKPSSSIGGDLFDILKISDTKHVVYVGDISGHGVKAALMMTAVKSIISMLIEDEKNNLNPHYIITRLNKILCKELFFDDYMTLTLGIIDLERNEIRYLSAGHPSLLEYDLVNGKTKLLGKNGSIPVGWQAEHEYTLEDEDVATFSENKAYLMYTDGIFECENQEGSQLGLEGFTRFLDEFSDFNCGLMLPHKFKQKLTDLNYNINTDDFTMVEFQKIAPNKTGAYKKLFVVNSLLQDTIPIGKECFEAVMTHLKDNDLAIKTELVLNEFLNNIIEHGLEFKKDTIAALQLEITDKIKMTFWDSGVDWEIPEKTQDNIAAPGKFRGMGMQIIHSLVTKVDKQRFDEINETVIVMDPAKMKDKK
ncbi:MAG: SpoIIE family protein phosphatase [Candidatus Cloacimonadales bacterium]|nr:SpoIIE family protein phosphatase [Candidatus Cloacimonadales bacterium]